MKKIYMILAAITLLSMSLNAQTTKSIKNKVVAQPKSLTEKVDTPPDGYFRMGPSRASTTPVTTFPYTNGFDSQDEWNWWEFIDANSDGNTWALSSNQARCKWNSSREADDWLITAPIHLEAGKTYKFYIDAFAYSTSFPERLEVKLASANTATALSAGTTVISSTDVTWNENNVRTLSNENVTVSTTGNYYFGIHAISDANMFYLYVDDLKIDVEDTDPKIEVSPTTLTINDSGTNNTFTVQGSNLGDNVGVTPNNGFSTTTTDQNWGFVNNNGSVSGTVTVTYEGRDLSATGTVAVANNQTSATVTVNYRADLYIVGDFGNGWDFSSGTPMTYNSNNNTYTATITVDADNLILFARKLGESNPWNTRLVFGPNSDGDWWVTGDNANGTIDLYDDDPIKFVNGDTYTVTINATTGALTIEKFVLPPPENVVATPNETNATVTWDAPSDLPTVPGTVNQSVTEGFENGTTGWTFIDADGDGYNWTWNNNASSSSNMITNNGNCIVYSESYHNSETGSGGTILYPENWLISPEVVLDGTLSLYACGQDGNGYHNEVFGVYVCVGSYNDVSEFVQVGADVTTTHSMAEYTYDLSQYQGQLGHIAIVHHNVYDQFILNIDDITYQIAVPSMVTIEPESYNVYLDGELVGSVDADEDLTYTFSNLAVGNYTVEISAVYPGGVESEKVPAEFTIMEKTATPTINVVTNADGSKTISVEGDGDVHLYVDGTEVTNPYTIMPSTDGDITVTVTATAQENGKLISDPATETVTVAEAGRSPMPTIEYTWDGDVCTITATGTGDVHMYVNGVEVIQPYIIEKGSQERTITVTATNQEDNLAISREAQQEIVIPTIDMSGFSQLNPQPANADAPIDMSKLMFVDRFSVEIPEDNTHPVRYDYTLEESQGQQRTSNTVEVPVQHTGSTGLGFYTLSEIDNDKNIGLNHKEGLKMDVMNAAMDFYLSPTSAPFFYTVEREEKDENNETYWSWTAVLQRTSDGKYKETLRPLYNYNEIINPGAHVQLDIDSVFIGQYNDYKAYVPVVWTMGFDRVGYNEDSPVHNSYGASVWRTGVAKVEMSYEGNDKPIAERQTGWNTKWTDNNTKCSLYMLDNIVATATMPTTNTLDYEPYMFRIFVESQSGKLRNYKYVTDENGNSVITANEGTVTGPICVWSGYVNDPMNDDMGVEITDGTDGEAKTITFKKNKVDRTAGYDPDGNPLGDWDKDFANAIFGAIDALGDENYNLTSEDLQIFVRFYYIVEGMAEGHTPWNPSRGEGDAPAGYGTESDPGTPDTPTSVTEVRYHGEVVETIYYNIQGMMSDKPFNGVNIVVNRYSDGATVVSKIIK